MTRLRTSTLQCYAACAALLLAQASVAADSKATLDIVADVPLPGDTSRFDYASLDATRHRLFIAHLGASEVLVFDTRTRKVVARIANVAQVHGVLAVPELQRVYASATGTNEIVAIDADSLAIEARMPGGRYPDGMGYAPDVRKLYVSDESGGTETVIDVDANRRVATIDLGGEAGNTQYDLQSRHIFVNVQTRGQLIEIDPATDRVVARIDLPGANGNHGLSIDAQRHVAFVACEGNDRLLVLDLKTRTVRNTFALGKGPDVLAEDIASGTLFVASESGIVDVFDTNTNPLRKRVSAYLAANAHVVAIDPEQRFAYFPLRNFSGRPVLRIVRIEP